MACQVLLRALFELIRGFNGPDIVFVVIQRDQGDLA